MRDEIYGVIQAMRNAERKYCSKYGVEFCVDITAYEMDANSETALRKVVDYENGYDRFWVDGGKGGGNEK